MKLIIREYLASLRERNELDALLPDLLSQMGLEVFSKPSIGTRQYGVDIAAFGSIDREPNKVYLFSVKAGDISRNDWDGDSMQSLRPSLNEIIDVYIPNYLPAKYRANQVEICICFGGNIKEEVRSNISSYGNQHTKEKISFSEWGGEKISGYIEKYLLDEKLLPQDFHRLLRKSLAMLDDPDISVNYYHQLIKSFSNKEYKTIKDRLTVIRQIYLCMWILYVWCREENNVEAAFQASEISLLHAWNLMKPQFEKKDKTSKSMYQTLDAIIILQMQVNFYFLEQKVIPHVSHLYALSNAVQSSCHIDTNLKLFDILGRLALGGIWLIWYLQRLQKIQSNDAIENMYKSINQYSDAIKQLIHNNPMLLTPCKDDQAIDIALAVLFLASIQDYDYINTWLSTMTNGCRYLLNINGAYPCNLHEYHKLLEHPKDKEGYKEKVTGGSILYPYIAIFSALFGFDDIYKQIQKLKEEELSHCNFQLWYPDKTSEEHYYLDTDIHGVTLCDVPVDENQKYFLDLVFKECENTQNFEELSVVKYDMCPIILLASRRYRLPMPIHFLQEFRQRNTKNNDTNDKK